MAARIRRRAFLAGAAAVAFLAACSKKSDSDTTAESGSSASTGSSGSTSGGASAGEPNAYRRSSRHVKYPCNACVAHNRSRYYATAEAAEADPPHDGCSCEVRGQVIADAEAADYFADGRTVFDTRAA